VWSEHFEHHLADAEAARDAIVKGVGRALQVATVRAEGARVAQNLSESPSITELESAGWAAMMASPSANTLPEAEAAFREVLKRDPESVRAMRGLAAHHLVMIGDMHAADRESYLPEAEQLLYRVLKRNPAASPPYFYLGILHTLRGELQAALESFAHSTALNPSFAPGYAQMGNILTRLGRPDEAIEQIRYAMRVSPKDPNFQIFVLYAGWAELERGHDDAAFEWLFRALALNPRSAQANGSLAAVYALTGDLVNAVKYAAKLRELTPGFSDEQRLNGFGSASESSTMPHRLFDGCRLALASSR
jgi:tetratricopeptide (TPR) repeat protein